MSLEIFLSRARVRAKASKVVAGSSAAISSRSCGNRPAHSRAMAALASNKSKKRPSFPISL